MVNEKLSEAPTGAKSGGDDSEAELIGIFGRFTKLCFFLTNREESLPASFFWHI